jgi:hypothetical protein
MWTYITLNEPNDTYGTVATGINNHGQIVGYCRLVVAVFDWGLTCPQ